MAPQADGVVSNGTGSAVRSDINGQLAAVFTNHSGATEPSTTYAYQWWADTTTGLLKIRNAANSGWITVGTLASTNLGLLTTTTAASTYQTQAGMSSYAPLASPTFTGTVTIPAGASISGFAALGTAQSFTKAQRGTTVALTDAATVAVDLSLGNFYTLTLGGNRTLGAPTNQTAGQSGVIVITQDGTGSRTLAYNSVWKFPSGTAPTLTTTASAVDVLAYYVESSTRITARLLSDVK